MRIIILICLSLLSFIYSISSYAGNYLYAANLCEQPGYHCVWTQPGQTWQQLFPDPYQRDIVMRINRFNMQLYSGMVLAIPNNLQSLDIMDFSPMDKQIIPQGRKVIVFNPKENAFGAYDENGQLIKWGPAAGGRDWCSDTSMPCHTTEGSYTIYAKNGVNCKSKIFPVGKGGAPMPYCMFFNGGYAIHGSPEVPGFNASHGCIRIFTQDARWLNQNFINVSGQGSGTGTKVIVMQYD